MKLADVFDRRTPFNLEMAESFLDQNASLLIEISSVRRMQYKLVSDSCSDIVLDMVDEPYYKSKCNSDGPKSDRKIRSELIHNMNEFVYK